MLYTVEESKVNFPNEKHRTDYIKWQQVINAIKTNSKQSVSRTSERCFNYSFGKVIFDLALEKFLQVGLGGRGDKEGHVSEW